MLTILLNVERRTGRKLETKTATVRDARNLCGLRYIDIVYPARRATYIISAALSRVWDAFAPRRDRQEKQQQKLSARELSHTSGWCWRHGAGRSADIDNFIFWLENQQEKTQT